MTKINETECEDDVRGVARLFYERYCHNADNLNYRGEQCPTWEQLPSATRSHWCAVSKMALDQSNYVALQAAHRTGEVFAKKRIAAMRTRPMMWAATKESFGAQLVLIAEIGYGPRDDKDKSGISPLAELQRRLYGPGNVVPAEPIDEAWAAKAADVALAFLEEKWARDST